MPWGSILLVAAVLVGLGVFLLSRYPGDTARRRGMISLCLFALAVLADCGILFCYIRTRPRIADEVYFLGMCLNLLAPVLNFVGLCFAASGIGASGRKLPARLGLALNAFHLAAFVLFIFVAFWVA